MLNYVIPEHLDPDYEKARLKKLRDYEILDTPPENAFDTIAMLAAEIFDAPNAFVSFVDAERVFFKANTSRIKEQDVIRERSFCALAILNNEASSFEDIQLISHQFPDLDIGNTKFYAAAPLVTPEGYKLGTVCVMDTVTRKPTKKQLDMLKMLSKIVMEKLELRIAARKSLMAHDDRLHMLVHDLKNPMTTISLQSELIGRISDVDPKAGIIADKINQQSKNIVNTLNNILSAARRIDGSIKLQKTKVDLKSILYQIQQNFSLILENKRQCLVIDVEEPIEIYGNQERLQDIFENLVSNATKYSEPGKKINISIQMVENKVIVLVKDNGQGLSPEDMDKLFIKFARLSPIPTGREHSHGLGLSIVKMFVDLHKGRVWAESKGKGFGTTFFVELPIK